MDVKTFRRLLIRYLDRRAGQAWNSETAALSERNFQALLRETGDTYAAAVKYAELWDDATWHNERTRALFFESDFAENCSDEELQALLEDDA